MKRASVAAVAVMLFAVGLVNRVSAQDDIEDDSRLNTNLAFTIVAPLNPMSQFVKVGGGFVGGAGYNISKRNAFIGEFMWNRLGATDAALAPIRSALQSTNIDGHGNLFAVTGNYRFELQGRTAGVYFIGGGGWYHRTATLQTEVTTGSSISCTPSWLWWGFQCESGTVTASQKLASSTSDALGVNGGIGITFKKATEPRYRFYMEARYHYAPTKNVKTELIPITVGIRF